jgi:hypothetical protein
MYPSPESKEKCSVTLNNRATVNPIPVLRYIFWPTTTAYAPMCLSINGVAGNHRGNSVEWRHAGDGPTFHIFITDHILTWWLSGGHEYQNDERMSIISGCWQRLHTALGEALALVFAPYDGVVARSWSSRLYPLRAQLIVLLCRQGRPAGSLYFLCTAGSGVPWKGGGGLGV